jgi:signal transduction histidine kinase
MRRLAVFVAVVGATAWVGIFVLEILMARASGPYDFGPAILALGLVGSAVIGFVILRRTGNSIGWIFLAFGTCGLVWGFTGEYLVYAKGVAPLPAQTSVAIVTNVMGNAMVFTLALICLLFPTGHVSSPRWRWVLWVWWTGFALATLWNVMRPGIIWGAEDRVSATIASPVHAPIWLTTSLIDLGALLGLVAGLAGIVSLVIRARHASGEERLQIRWLSWVAASVATLLMSNVLLVLATSRWSPAWVNTLSNAMFVIMALLIVIGTPVAVAIAILKYKLYEIDVVISKTIVFAALVLFITLVYAVIVAGVGALIGSAEDRALSITATIVVAVLFQPVRERVRRFANRIVYGERATPYEVLARFSDRVGGSYAAEDILPRTARVIAEGVGAARVEIWLRLGDVLSRAATWPASDDHVEAIPVDGEALPSLDSDRTVPVRRQDRLLGAIAVTKPRNEPLSPQDVNLVDRLAEQSALVLANVGLTADLEARLTLIRQQAATLRASRQRIVAAQDEERRQLERNIHDGAQQHLVALAVKLRLAKATLAKDPARAREMLVALRDQVDDALDTLQSLSLGVYPPLLEDQGIAVALATQYTRSGMPVRMDADRLGRYPIEIEAAVYFCVLEALQNAAKYAEASRIDVSLTEHEGVVTFEVRDDGAGFDANGDSGGTGLHGMRDRLAVFGGDATIVSAPGIGTTVRGRVPISAVVPA